MARARHFKQSGSISAGWLRWLGMVGGAVGSLALAMAWAPYVGLDPRWGYLLGFAWVCGQTLAVAGQAPLLSVRALTLLPIPLGVLAAVGLTRPPAFMAALAVSAAWLFGASLVGATVGARIERAGYLLPVAVVSSLADLYSVLHPGGPTAAVEKSPRMLSLTALPFPMPGTRAVEPFLGAGDVAFAALYVVAARRHGLSVPRTLGALALGFAATAVCVLVLERSIPALPWLGLAMVAAHPRARRLPAGEKKRAGWLMAVVAAMVAGAFLLR